MDQDKKEHKLKQRFSEILRCVLYLVVVASLMSCIIILFLEQQKVKQRLTAIDDKTNTFERILRYKNDKDERLEAKALFVREKRAVALSLESLEKRLKVLEFRWVSFLLHSMWDSEEYQLQPWKRQCFNAINGHA